MKITPSPSNLINTETIIGEFIIQMVNVLVNMCTFREIYIYYPVPSTHVDLSLCYCSIQNVNVAFKVFLCPNKALNICLILGHCLRRWPGIKTFLNKCIICRGDQTISALSHL